VDVYEIEKQQLLKDKEKAESELTHFKQSDRDIRAQLRELEAEHQDLSITSQQLR